MRVSDIGATNLTQDMIPLNPYETDFIGLIKSQDFFISGINRGNVQPGHWVFQTLFQREHNRQCDGIRKIYPLWPDEEIFQLSKKLLLLKVASIVFNEYIPTICGTANNILN